MKTQRFFGILYLLAGIGKAFPQLEDVPAVLRSAAEANMGSSVQGLSLWLAQYGQSVNIVIGFLLAISGLLLLINHRLVKWVIYGQMVMMCFFVAILFRAQPQVLVLDAVFFIAAIYMLRYHNRVRINQVPLFQSKEFENANKQQLRNHTKFDDYYDVVVVGAGMSGLTATYELQDKKVLCLEKSAVFGGNARFETESEVKYPTAGVCFKLPHKGTDIANLLDKLDLTDKWKISDQDTVVFFDTKLLMSCIGEVLIANLKQPLQLLNPAVWKLTFTLTVNWITAKQYVIAPKKLGDPIFADLYVFLDQFGRSSKKFPDMPWHAECGWSRQEMEMLDSISLYDFLFEPDKTKHIPNALKPTKTFGRLVQSAIETTLRVECLEVKDVSAYVGLHFLIGYLRGSLVTLPGGNGHISNKLVTELQKNPQVTLASQCDVENIDSSNDVAHIRFSQNGHNHTIQAGSVIWAAPKHVIGNIIADLPQVQLDAIKEIAHHDYCVANVTLSHPALLQHFGGYIIEPTQTEREYEWCKTGVCIVPQWMDVSRQHEKGILTLLKPIAPKNAQNKVGQKQFKDMQNKTYEEISELLMTINVDKSHIENIKLWSWDKALVVSTKEQLKNNIFVNASKNHKLIYFANQDSIGIGNIESAITAGQVAAEQIRIQLEIRKAS
jgi:protoporphyrinogen oxidase